MKTKMYRIKGMGVEERGLGEKRPETGVAQNLPFGSC